MKERGMSVRIRVVVAGVVAAAAAVPAAAAVAALASRLGVSTGAAQHALQQIGALSRQGGVDPTGPAFATIARGLGVSPAQLAAALGGVKQVLADK
jgi:membrane-bound lytic murein transglycosylase B